MMTAEVQRAFLTAEWRYLAMLTFEVMPSLLRPFIPRGTELDSHDGRALISLVGFRFLRTRVLGVRIPFHQNFDEVNLRLYVRREAGREVRRGVSFVREIVPRRLVAFVARLVFNEPYVALRMRSEVPTVGGAAPGRIRYAWKGLGDWQHLGLTATGSPKAPEEPSEMSFVTDHHWGYSRQRDGSTLEYRVEHPPWRIWAAEQSEVGGDLGGLYGAGLGGALAGRPTSALLAEGSSVAVSRPVPLPLAAATAAALGAA